VSAESSFKSTAYHISRLIRGAKNDWAASVIGMRLAEAWLSGAENWTGSEPYNRIIDSAKWWIQTSWPGKEMAGEASDLAPFITEIEEGW
jgi:hypothetical protein